MNVNVLIVGQSNAAYLSMTNQSAIASEVAGLLGYDGVSNTVSSIGGAQYAGNAATYETAIPNEPLLPTADTRHGFLSWTGSGFTQANNAVGGAELSYLQGLSAQQKAAPTVILWLHDEADSTRTGVAPSTWADAVRYEVGLIRSTLGQTADTTPVVFSTVPFHPQPGSLVVPGGSARYTPDAAAAVPSAQALKDGFQALINDSAFNAVQGPQTAYFDMSEPSLASMAPDFGTPGGPHMSNQDAASMAHSLAPIAARQLQAYAMPGSPAALSAASETAPRAWLAETVAGAPNELLVHVTDTGSSLVTPNASAASGLGWTLDGSQTTGTAATSAMLLNPGAQGDQDILLTFATPVAGAHTLYYGYGNDRLAASPGATAQGNQFQDADGRALVAPLSGLTIGIPDMTFSATGPTLSVDNTFAGAKSVRNADGSLTVNGYPISRQFSTVQFLDGSYVTGVDTKAAEIDRLYRTVVGHGADPASVAASTAIGLGAVPLAQSMLDSQEYKALHGGEQPSDAAFITSLYQNAVGRPPSSAEMATAEQALAGGTSRAVLASYAAASPEAVARQAASGFGVWVPDQGYDMALYAYRAGVNRAPSLTEARALSAFMEQPGYTLSNVYGSQDVAGSITSSQEFKSMFAVVGTDQYVSNLYNDAFGRPPSSADFSFATSFLKNGGSPKDLLASVFSSVESQAHVIALGITSGN